MTNEEIGKIIVELSEAGMKLSEVLKASFDHLNNKIIDLEERVKSLESENIIYESTIK